MARTHLDWKRGQLSVIESGEGEGFGISCIRADAVFEEGPSGRDDEEVIVTTPYTASFADWNSDIVSVAARFAFKVDLHSCLRIWTRADPTACPTIVISTVDIFDVFGEDIVYSNQRNPVIVACIVDIIWDDNLELLSCFSAALLEKDIHTIPLDHPIISDLIWSSSFSVVTFYVDIRCAGVLSLVGNRP